MLLAPSLSGMFMTYLLDGRKGLRDLFARMTIWRGRWAAALLIFPALILIVSLALTALVSPEFLPIFFAGGIVMGLAAGFFEETGWMGFAYPRMKLVNGALIAALMLGLVHAVWHIVAGFLGQFADLGSYWLPYFAAFSLFIVALRVLIVWVYENTGSLMLAQLMHASSTGFLAALTATEIAPQNWFIFYLVYAVALSAIAALVVIRSGKGLALVSAPAGRSI